MVTRVFCERTLLGSRASSRLICKLISAPKVFCRKLPYLSDRIRAQQFPGPSPPPRFDLSLISCVGRREVPITHAPLPNWALSRACPWLFQDSPLAPPGPRPSGALKTGKLSSQMYLTPTRALPSLQKAHSNPGARVAEASSYLGSLTGNLCDTLRLRSLTRFSNSSTLEDQNQRGTRVCVCVCVPADIACQSQLQWLWSCSRSTKF